MTTTNLIGIRYGEENPVGTPATRLRTARYTGEGVTSRNTFLTSEEIRVDRQPSGTTLTDTEVVGPLNGYLVFRSSDELLGGVMAESWVTTPTRDNAGTADSVITAVTDTTDTFTVASGGAAFLAGMLIRTSGFTNAANNALFTVASSTATTVVVAGTPTLTDEAAPPANARITVVGVQGASADITATATGLSSTILDFTTMPCPVGSWIKIGGTATATKFDTAALNTWVRVIARTATTLTLDNRPATWGVDAGTGKTIRLWFSDYLRNGSTKRTWTYEKVFAGHTPDNYLVFDGVMMSGCTLTAQPGQQVSLTFETVGREPRVSSTTPIDASPIDASPSGIMNAVTDVALIAEGGVLVTGPNYIQQFTFSVANNIMQGKAVSVFGSAVVELGQLEISGNLTTYCGDLAIWDKIKNNTATSITAVFAKDNNQYLFHVPVCRLRGDAPSAPGTNQFSLINGSYVAEYNSSHIYTAQISRFEYVES